MEQELSVAKGIYCGTCGKRMTEEEHAAGKTALVICPCGMSCVGPNWLRVDLKKTHANIQRFLKKGNLLREASN